MKFGKVDQPQLVDFTLPTDHPNLASRLSKCDANQALEIDVGCAKWNKADLIGFYPKGTKDELIHYSGQFNSIELNASFYRMFPPEQFIKWKEKTPDHFRFFPKVNQLISHRKRLIDTERLTDEFIAGAEKLEHKLGMAFLQMHDNFAPKNFDRVEKFVSHWPKHIPLAMEFRHTDWINDTAACNELFALLEENNKALILDDTAGRRDLMHMHLTSNAFFARFVGANCDSDYSRLDDWVERIAKWIEQGLRKIHFFIHQNIEEASPLLSAHFIKGLNQKVKTKIHIPKMAGDIARESELF